MEKSEERLIEENTEALKLIRSFVSSAVMKDLLLKDVFLIDRAKQFLERVGEES